MLSRLVQKTVFILVVTTACLVVAATEVNKITVFYYSTETMVSNYVSLKREFDRSLASQGDFSFQPISHATTFEEVAKANPDALLLLTSWHLKKLQKEMDLFPILVGERQGQNSQSHILTTNKENQQGSDLKGVTIATAYSADFARTILLDALGRDQGFLVDSFHLLVVPKDLDALMSVRFGMAQAALSSESSFVSFQQMNPAQEGRLHVVGRGEQTLLPILASSRQILPSAQQEVVAILRHMADNVAGKHKLQMLGIDGWQSYALIGAGGER